MIGAPVLFLSAKTPSPTELRLPSFVAPAATAVGGPELSSNPGKSAAVGVAAPYTADPTTNAMIGSVNARDRDIFMGDTYTFFDAFASSTLASGSVNVRAFCVVIH